MNGFQWPQPQLISTWAAELIDWWGRAIPHRERRIVLHQGKHWFVKTKPDPQELKRDYLAYLLGHKWANVAEVLLLSNHGFNSLVSLGVPLPRFASVSNTFLVRLAQDYRVEELPNADIDTAAASELVFSLWSRRRDAHAANRGYTSNIPIFFDHQTAFLAEPQLRDPGIFFQPGVDAGYAGRWRARVLADAKSISTKRAREVGFEEKLAIHFIQDLARFDQGVQAASSYLQTQSGSEWHEAIVKAGFGQTQANLLLSFLEQNRQNLARELETMRAILLSE